MRQFSGVKALAGGCCHMRDAACAQLLHEVAGGVGKLGEDEQFVVRMLLGDEFDEGVKFCIRFSAPLPALAQHT